MSTTSFSQHSQKLNSLDPSLFLGRLVWYSVSETSVAHSDLFNLLHKVGLEGYVPRVPSDVDVFRRVCSAGQKNRVPIVGQPGTWNNYLVRDLPVGNKVVSKKLVRETVASTGLLYEAQLCTLTFDRDTSTVNVVCDQSDQTACDIAAKIVADYYAERGMLGSYAIRELLRKILLSVNATNVRGPGGGVYFVNEAHGVTVDRLKALAGELPDGVVVHTLPLIDDADQKEMVRRAFESETTAELAGLVEEIAVLIKDADTNNKPISEDRVAGYFDKHEQAVAKVKEYHDLLEGGLGNADSYVDIFLQQVLELSTRVKVKPVATKP